MSSSDAFQVANTKGAPALSVVGATYVQTFMKGERGARLTTLSSQLVGPRVSRDGKKTEAGPMKELSGGISRESLTAEMDTILEEGKSLGEEALQANLADLFALAFEVADVREGRGERKLFLWMVTHLAKRMPKSVAALMRHVPHFASWKHLALLFEELSSKIAAAAGKKHLEDKAKGLDIVRAAIVQLWARQLHRDEERLTAYQAALRAVVPAADGEPAAKAPAAPKLSLAGKWAPRVGGAFDRRCGLGRYICAALDRLRAEAGKGKKKEEPAVAGAGAAAPAAMAVDGVDVDSDEDIVMVDVDELDAAASGLGDLSLAFGAPAATSSSSSSTGLGKVEAAVPFASQSKAQHGAEMRYRKLLSALGAQLDVVEQKLCGRVPDTEADGEDVEMGSYEEAGKGAGDKRMRGRWSEIQPEKVPSKANKKYRVAFLNAVGKKKWKRDPEAEKGVRGGIDTSESVGAQRSTDADREAAKEHFLEAVKKTLAGDSKGGLKAGRLQPHELVATYLNARLRAVDQPDGTVTFEADLPDAPIIEALWAALIKDLKDRKAFKAGVPIVDVSGSMSGLPMECSIAFGIMMAQLIPESSPFHGKFLTFHESPTWVDISDCKTFAHAVKKTKDAPWGGSTNFGQAMRLMLDTLQGALAAGHKIEDMPEASTLYVFSDMEFDAAPVVDRAIFAGGRAVGIDPRNVYGIRDDKQLLAGSKAAQEAAIAKCAPFFYAGKDIRLAYDDAGLKPPTIVFWNLRASGNPTFQAETTTPGVAMLSGFSQAILKQFMEGGDLNPPPAPEAAAAGAAGAEGDGKKAAAAAPAQDTPWDVLRKKLGSIRYDRIRETLEHKGEGPLANYKWVPSPTDRAEELAKLEAVKRKAEEEAAKKKAEKEEQEKARQEALAIIAAAGIPAAGAGAAK